MAPPADAARSSPTPTPDRPRAGLRARLAGLLGRRAPATPTAAASAAAPRHPCTACGRANRLTARFCPDCGQPGLGGLDAPQLAAWLAEQLVAEGGDRLPLADAPDGPLAFVLARDGELLGVGVRQDPRGTVEVAEAQALLAAARARGLPRALLVTTGTVSAAARHWAADQPIALRDGSQLPRPRAAWAPAEAATLPPPPRRRRERPRPAAVVLGLLGLLVALGLASLVLASPAGWLAGPPRPAPTAAATPDPAPAVVVPSPSPVPATPTRVLPTVAVPTPAVPTRPARAPAASPSPGPVGSPSPAATRPGVFYPTAVPTPTVPPTATPTPTPWTLPPDFRLFPTPLATPVSAPRATPAP